MTLTDRDKQIIDAIKAKGVTDPKEAFTRFKNLKKRLGEPIDYGTETEADQTSSFTPPPKDYTPSSPLSEAPEQVQAGVAKLNEDTEEPGMLSEAMSDIKEEAVTQSKRLGEAVGEGNVPEAISGAVRTALSPLQGLNPFIDEAVKVTQPIIESVTKPVTQMLEKQFGTDVADQAASAIESGFTKTLEEFNKLPEPVKESIRATGNVSELIGTVFGARGIKQSLKSDPVAQAITKTAGKAVEKTADVVTPEFIKTGVERAKNKLGDMAEKRLQKEAENIYMRGVLDYTDKELNSLKTDQKVLNKRGNIESVLPNRQDQEVIDVAKGLIGSNKLDITAGYGIQERQVNDAITESAELLQTVINKQPESEISKSAFMQELKSFIKAKPKEVPSLRSSDGIEKKIMQQVGRNIEPVIDLFTNDNKMIPGNSILQLRKDADKAMQQAGLDIFGDNNTLAAKEAYDVLRDFINKKAQDMNPNVNLSESLKLQRQMYKLRDELAWKNTKASKKELRSGKGLGKMIETTANVLGIPRSEPIELAILIGSTLAIAPASVLAAMLLGGVSLAKIKKVLSKARAKSSKEVIRMMKIAEDIENAKIKDSEFKSLAESLAEVPEKKREQTLQDIIDTETLQRQLREEKEFLEGQIEEGIKRREAAEATSNQLPERIKTPDVIEVPDVRAERLREGVEKN